jgi:periplasmic copper chaperone A
MTVSAASKFRPVAMVMLAVGLVFSLALSGAALAGGDKINVMGPWVRSAPPAMKIHAAYLVVMNPTGKAVDLVGVASPQYKMAELHLSKVEDGIATMVKQDQISVPANGKLTFAPGSFHVMLMHPRMPIRTGDTVDITLKFSDGSALAVKAPVQKTQGMPKKMRHGGHKMN